MTNQALRKNFGGREDRTRDRPLTRRTRIRPSYRAGTLSKCFCLHLPALILSVDSDGLVSIKILQTLIGNRNYFYSVKVWSNFDQDHQNGVLYTIKISVSKSIKVTCSNFDQSDFDSVNGLSDIFFQRLNIQQFRLALIWRFTISYLKMSTIWSIKNTGVHTLL